MNTSSIVILSSVLLGLFKRNYGSSNSWKTKSVEELQQYPLKENEFFHGITLVDPQKNTTITDPEEAFNKIQELGFSIKRGEHRPIVGSQQQRAKTPDMGVYLTKKIEEARWYAYPFVAILEVPYDLLKQIKYDEDNLGMAITRQLPYFHQRSPILNEYMELIGNAFRRAANKNLDTLVPGSHGTLTFGDLLVLFNNNNVNAYNNYYSAMGKLINKEGLTQDEEAKITSWIKSGLLEIPNYFMPMATMPSIPIKHLYLLQK